MSTGELIHPPESSLPEDIQPAVAKGFKSLPGSRWQARKKGAESRQADTAAPGEKFQPCLDDEPPQPRPSGPSRPLRASAARRIPSRRNHRSW